MTNQKTKERTISSGFEDEAPLPAPTLFSPANEPVDVDRQPEIVKNTKKVKTRTPAAKTRNRKGAPMIKLSLYLSPELDTRLRVYCALSRISMTEVINQCLPPFLDRAEKTLHHSDIEI